MARSDHDAGHLRDWWGKKTFAAMQSSFVSVLFFNVNLCFQLQKKPSEIVFAPAKQLERAKVELIIASLLLFNNFQELMLEPSRKVLNF